MKENGALEPGGGLRNWGFKGMPLERWAETAKIRRMISQRPVDWVVYFWGGVSWPIDGEWGIKGRREVERGEVQRMGKREGRRKLTLWTGMTRFAACAAVAAALEVIVVS